MKFRRKSAQPSAHAQEIVRLIREEGDDWAFDAYRATHVGGAIIWIANGSWAASVEIPGYGLLIPQAKDCTATADHKAIWAALEDLREKRRDAAVQKYLGDAAQQRIERARKLSEQARRLEFDAGTLSQSAERARRLAEAAKAEAARLQPTGEDKRAQALSDLAASDAEHL